jgi:small conductance mechanosensitive channel
MANHVGDTRAPNFFAAPVDALRDKLTGWIETGAAMLPNFALAAILVVAFGISARSVGRWTHRVVHKLSNNEALASLLAGTAKIAVIVLGVSIALTLLHLDKAVTSLLAGVGVVGLALGFAFQDIAANFMSGALLAFRGSFEPGDLIEVAGKLGTVEQTHLRRTVLRTFDGLHVIVPNKELSQNIVVNYTRTHERRIDLELGVAYSSDLERTREVIREALEQVEWRDPSREVQVLFKRFGESSIDFDVYVWLDVARQFGYENARSDMVVRIKQALDAAGLTIPFPIRTVDFGADIVGGVSRPTPPSG